MRITTKYVERQIKKLNEKLGTPSDTWTRDLISGKIASNIGNYHLYRCEGIYALDQIENHSGGVGRTATYNTLRELSIYLQGRLDA